MKKLALIILASASACILVLSAAPQSADAGNPCVRTEFKTKMISDACKRGGQEEAVKEMKKFMWLAKGRNPAATCMTCHTSLLPKYELKPEGFQLLLNYGGK